MRNDKRCRTARPKNEGVAMVLCPKWANLPPIGLAYIKGAAQRRPVRCFDLNHDLLKRCVPDYSRNFGFENYCGEIGPFMTANPDFGAFERTCHALSRHYAGMFDEWVGLLKGYGVVGFSLYQENLAMSTILARRLRREHGVVCLAGGPSANMDGRVFLLRLLNDGTFDAGVLGIAEDTIDEALERIITGQDLDDVPCLVLPGSGGEVLFTPSKRSDLARFSPQDYGDFDLDDYFKGRSDWMSIYAVVGCLGNCEFCTIHEFYPGYQHKPVENITREMLLLQQRYGRKRFFFSDGMFLGKRADALALFEFAIANGLKVGLQIRLLPYWEDEELVSKASQCVFYLQVGFESASVNVRKAMRKMIDPERTQRIYRLFYKYQIPLYTNIIVGYPNETDEDFEDTYRFLEEYLAVPDRLVGMNSFFIPNGFPTEKYNVRMDAAGHWTSDAVDVYDRLKRVGRICRLAERLGRSAHSVYPWPGVEGLPLDSICPFFGESPAIPVERYVENPVAQVGFQEVRTGERYAEIRGWAKLPGRDEPGRDVLIRDPRGRIIGQTTVSQDRPDVAEHFDSPALRRSGWACVFRKDAIACPPHALRAYLYTPDDRTAWRLATPGVLTRSLRSAARRLPQSVKSRLKDILREGMRILSGRCARTDPR